MATIAFLWCGVAFCDVQPQLRGGVAYPPCPDGDIGNCSTDFVLDRSHFRGSGFYTPKDPELAKPSSAKLQKFYMYRTQGPPPDYPVENVDTTNLDGALWYLHHEVIQTCTGEGYLSNTGKWGDRKFAISRLRRFMVTTKATTPLIAKGMNFGVFKAFDSGEATGPHISPQVFGAGTGRNSMPEWEKYGFFVGCEYVGQFPHQQWPSGNDYPNTIWYSLPGECPTYDRKGKTAECNIMLPGGACEQMPTGQGNCTYHVEEAGELDIDEMVGIKPRWSDRAAFCSQCHTEGGPHGPGGCGLNFWGPNINDKNANAERVAKVAKMFDDKYPDMPKSADMAAPPCDFDQSRYGFSGGPGKSQAAVHEEMNGGGQLGCSNYGCGTYDRNHHCQCNDKCSQYGNCCYDYWTKCGR